jgi:hypothetical protein
MSKNNLKEWYVTYIKNRDLILRKISSIDQTSSSDKEVIVIYKDGLRETCIISEDLTSFIEILYGKSKEERISIIVYNRKNYMNLLVKEWSTLKDYKALTIMFVNPNSSLEKKWLIKPHVHDRITESASLKLGIESISLNVEYMD